MKKSKEWKRKGFHLMIFLNFLMILSKTHLTTKRKI